jgi:hypothetical protein
VTGSAPASKLVQAVDVAAGLAYVLVVAATLYLLFPGLRTSLRVFVNHVIFNYRYGVFLAQRSEVAAWVKDAMQGKVTDEPKAERP